MSYHTWHNYGYGICTDKLETAEVSRIQELIRCAPEYEKVVDKLFQERGITEPTADDYLELEINGPYATEKYAALARHAGFSASSDTMAIRGLKNGLLKLRRELELPQTLAQAGVDPVKLRQQEQQIIAAALADPCCDTNPVKPEANMLRQILTQVSGHG